MTCRCPEPEVASRSGAGYCAKCGEGLPWAKGGRAAYEERKTMSAAPSTAAELLALPEYGHGVRRITCKCGHHIDIPYMTELRAGYMADSSIIAAVDENGVSWSPVNTEFGWKRRRI